jgi:hypothetical protein
MTFSDEVTQSKDRGGQFVYCAMGPIGYQNFEGKTKSAR